MPFYGARARPKKTIGDIWDENLILANRRIKDRDLKTYHINNFDIDQQIDKVFNSKGHAHKPHSKAIYALI